MSPTQQKARSLRLERDNAVKMFIVELERTPRNRVELKRARGRLRHVDVRVTEFLDQLEAA